MLPAAIDIDETILGESYAKELRKFPLTANTVGRRISDNSRDLCDRMSHQPKTSRSALKVIEVTDVVDTQFNYLIPSCVGKLYK